MPSRNKGFLICQSDILVFPDCSDRWSNSEHSDNCRNNHLSMALRCHGNEAIHSAHNRDAKICRLNTKFFCLFLGPNRYKFRAKPTHLFLKKLDIASTGKCRHFDISMFPNNI